MFPPLFKELSDEEIIAIQQIKWILPKNGFVKYKNFFHGFQVQG